MPAPDITKLTWQLNVALAGGIFAVFSLIYNPNYIYYGFITFLYGVIAHFIDILFRHIPDEKNCKYPTFFILQSILMISWILIMLFSIK